MKMVRLEPASGLCPANVSNTSRPAAVPSVWNWLDNVLIAAASSVSRNTSPNHFGMAVVMNVGMIWSDTPLAYTTEMLRP